MKRQPFKNYKKFIISFYFKIVVVHDPCLDRLCGFNVQVANVKYENLPPFADRILLHFSEGQYFETKEAKTKYMPKLEVNKNCIVY